MRNFAIGVIMSAIDRVSAPLRGIRTSFQGYSNSTKQATRDTEALSRIMGGLKGILATVGVARVASGIRDLVTSTVDFGDSVNDLAGSLGLSNAALQEYRYVAQLTGFSAGEMDTALSKMTVNLGNGSGAVEEAIQSLGISIEQMRASAPDQRLEMIADAMASISDPSRQAAITTALFGRSSLQLTNALAAGSGGIRELRQEAHELGYVLSDETLATIGDAGDSIDRFKGQLTGLRNQIGVQFIPMMQEGLKGITDFARDNQGTIDAVVNGIIKFVSAIGSIINSAIGPIKNLAVALVNLAQRVLSALGISDLTKTMEGLGVAIGGVVNFVTGFIETITPIAPVIAGIIAVIGAWQAITTVMTAVQWALNVAMTANPIGLIIVAIGALIGAIALLAMNWESVTAWFGETFEAIVGWFEDMRQQTIERMRKDWDRMIGVIKGVGDWFKNVFSSIGSFFRGVWTGVSNFFSGLWQRWRESVANTRAFFMGIFQGLGDWFMGLWTGIGEFFGGIWDGIVNGVKTAVDWILEFIRPVTDAIGWVVDGITGLFGGGNSAEAAPSMSQAAPLRAGAGDLVGRDTKETTEVVVDFKNLPRGTRVQSEGARQGLNMSMGYANVGF